METGESSSRHQRLGLARLDATAQAALVRSGELDPIDLVESAVGRIEALNSTVNAVIHTRFDQARSEALATGRDGRFCGVPVLVKDLGAAQDGEPFELGSSILMRVGYRAKATSYIVQSLVGAGCIVLGRTNTPEFGTNITTEPLSHGPTKNPWDTAYSSGGSSGGSAVAVATGMVPVAHASDGGGSIRIPASCCGIVGLKPSRGRVSKGPLSGDGWAGSAIDGALTRSVRDAAGILDCLSGYRSGDPSTAPPFVRSLSEEVGVDPGRLRVGLVDHSSALGAPIAPDCSEALRRVGEIFEAAGHRVEAVWPRALAEAEFQEYFLNVVVGSIAAQIASLSRLLGREIALEELEPDNQLLVRKGRELPAWRYVESVDWLQGFGRRLMSFWSEEGYDLLVTPVIAQPPPPLGYLADPVLGLDRQLEYLGFTAQFNVSGQPAISLPLHMRLQAPVLPIGVQLVAAYAREDLLVRVASWLETVAPWRDEWPPIRC
ncbi:MAG: amidase [Ferrimicrobium sp.]